MLVRSICGSACIRDVTACTAKPGASARDLFIRDLFIRGKFEKDSATIYRWSATFGELEKKYCFFFLN